MRVGIALLVAAVLGAAPANAAVLYSIKDLGTLGGSTSLAGGINASGWVAGASSLAGDTAQHAFLYDGSSMFDLNSLIDPRSNWSITDATGINDAGQIAGWSGDLYSGVGHALFLTPLSTSAVPEPAAWAMMIVGFGMIGGLARRKPISGAPSNT